MRSVVPEMDSITPTSMFNTWESSHVRVAFCCLAASVGILMFMAPEGDSNPQVCFSVAQPDQYLGEFGAGRPGTARAPAGGSHTWD